MCGSEGDGYCWVGMNCCPDPLHILLQPAMCYVPGSLTSMNHTSLSPGFLLGLVNGKDLSEMRRQTEENLDMHNPICPCWVGSGCFSAEAKLLPDRPLPQLQVSTEFCNLCKPTERSQWLPTADPRVLHHPLLNSLNP